MTKTETRVPMMGGFFTKTTYQLNNGWNVIEGLTGCTMLDAAGSVRHINGRSPFSTTEAIEYASVQ